MRTKMSCDWPGMLQTETYFVIFAAAGDKALIDTAETRVNGVCALCITLVFTH